MSADGKPANTLFTKGLSAASIIARRSGGLTLLVESYFYAREVGRSPWDFAVAIRHVREAGLTDSDLRWLICKGFVQQAYETSAAGEPTRSFKQTNGLVFDKRSCFIIAESGLVFCQDALSRAVHDNGHPDSDGAFGSTSGNGALKPIWDHDRQELRVGQAVVKRYKVPAPNQERILAAFQEEDWPVHIHDPLPGGWEQDPKRRLHDTITSLNRRQKRQLIHFEGDGSGQGVRWRLVDPPHDGR